MSASGLDAIRKKIKIRYKITFRIAFLRVPTKNPETNIGNGKTNKTIIVPIMKKTKTVP
jgi:hypothetical protein